MGLFKYLEEERCDNLKSLKYTAFALGNKQYEHFCAMGKWIDSKAKALGATRLLAKKAKGGKAEKASKGGKVAKGGKGAAHFNAQEAAVSCINGTDELSVH